MVPALLLCELSCTQGMWHLKLCALQACETLENTANRIWRGLELIPLQFWLQPYSMQ